MRRPGSADPNGTPGGRRDSRADAVLTGRAPVGRAAAGSVGDVAESAGRRGVADIGVDADSADDSGLDDSLDHCGAPNSDVSGDVSSNVNSDANSTADDAADVAAANAGSGTVADAAVPFATRAYLVGNAATSAASPAPRSGPAALLRECASRDAPIVNPPPQASTRAVTHAARSIAADVAATNRTGPALAPAHRSAGDDSPPRRRPACVDVPAFPLQLLLRREPDWSGGPVAVVAEDRPQGRVLWVNEAARRLRVLPGQRYAAALALATGLRAGVVAETEIRAAADEAAERLRRFSPAVEPSRDEPGVFWLDAGGLDRLHPDLRVWAAGVQEGLAAIGLRSCVVVGFTRFGAYAIARALAPRVVVAPPRRVADDTAGPHPVADDGRPSTAPEPAGRPRLAPNSPGTPPPAPRRDPPADTAGDGAAAGHGADRSAVGGAAGAAGAAGSGGSPTAPRTCVVLPDGAAEMGALRRVPLDRLGIDPDARDLLAKLGVRTVDRFLDLPPQGLRERFGDVVHRLHRMASGETRDPLAPEAPPERLRAVVALEHPESDGARLLFLAKRLLDPLLFRAAERREAVTGLELRLRLERDGREPGTRGGLVRPAAPTLDAAQLLELVRLRLEATKLPCGATDVELTAHTVAATQEQLALFVEKPKRDLAAADRAIARLRAEFGDDAVVRAQLRDAHLPEAAFDWVPLEHARLPRPRPAPRSGAGPGTTSGANAGAGGDPAAYGGDAAASARRRPAGPSATRTGDTVDVTADVTADDTVRGGPQAPRLGLVPPGTRAAPLREGRAPRGAGSGGVPGSSADPTSASPTTPALPTTSATTPTPVVRPPAAPSSPAPTPEPGPYEAPPPQWGRTAAAHAAVRAPLVRRVLSKPMPLPPRPRHEPGHELGGWMLRGFEQGSVVRIEGPYVVAGGWWGGAEVRREYHFAETARGHLFWVFYDVHRRKWFLQGDVS